MPVNRVNLIQKSFQLESIWVEVTKGMIPAGVTPSALDELKIQTGVTPPAPPTTPWILAAGVWNDGGEWIDTEFWID